MSKKEMKIKMKLEKIVETKTEGKEGFSFVFKPTLDELHKKVVLSVAASDPFQTMGDLGLPQNISDTVIVSFSRKEEQTKLGESGGKK